MFAETFPLTTPPKKMLPAHHKLPQTLPKGYMIITREQSSTPRSPLYIHYKEALRCPSSSIFFHL